MSELKQIKKLIFAESDLDMEYDNCEFINCDFAEINLGKTSFNHCKFIQCNLSLCKMNKTYWSEVEFIDCKMTGIDFTNCNKYSLSVGFTNSNLQYAIFSGLTLRGTLFSQCNMQELDFSETDLKGSLFKNCDLSRTIFSQTNLESTDFSSSFNYEINPVNNNLKKAKFSRQGLEGLLSTFYVTIVD